ncbi:hypothetical protein [Pseudonocardia nigra]|uniref:hypothetical protein n=1 Tax=Pseudonocardia nigra TaxID=1921578 RepID=UPI001C5E19F9|nr:hypothetical protein [Pseudonocardia nigra]
MAGPTEADLVLHVVIDGANVVGTRPDGWWRDRAGAARRLAGRLVAAVSTEPAVLAALAPHPPPSSAGLRLHLVLEGAAARVEGLPGHPDLDVVRAPADGDTAIVAVCADLSPAPVVVVTADRALRERVRATGAETTGPATLLRALPPDEG